MLALLILAAASTVSPVQKVIELLDGLKGKVQADVEAEGKLMEEFENYCDSESNSKEDAITSAKRTATDLQATIQDAKASVSTLTAETEELAAKVSSADQDLAAATKVRDSERSDFEAKEKDLVETVDTLERAVIVLKRGQTFLQKGGQSKNSKAMEALAMGLSKIVEASWVTSADKQVVQGLLQADDEDLSAQPQASVAAYESKGGDIISILQDMQTKAEQALSESRKEEMQAQHAYDMLKQDLTTSSATMNKRLSAAKAERSAAEETQNTAEGELSTTQEGKKTDETALAELKQTCSNKQEEWGRRQKSAQEEIGAIAKAKEVLAGGVKSFFMSGVKVVRRHVSDLADSRREKMEEVLRKLSGKHRSFALTQVLEAAESDPFGKVRGLIENLLERLMKEAGEEADAKAFCDTEMAKSKAKQADLTAAVDRHSVRIEKAVAGQATLEEQVKHLEQEVADIDKSTAEATKIRGEENTEYVRASAEYKEAAEAIANAMQVLQDYYAGQSFLQTSSSAAGTAQLSQPDFGGANTDVASTIISMLEAAEADFTKLLAETETEEQASASAFSTLQQDNKVAKASKQAAAKGKRGEIKSLELNLLNYKEDHAQTSKELDATLAYLDKLKPQCETKVMTYAERMQRREEEIAGLKEALAILEG
jgi:chromosome segregation ATPase